MIEGKNLRIAIHAKGAYTISVLDARGKTVNSIAGRGAAEHRIGPDGMNTGVYFVKIRQGLSAETASVVMQ
jgi:hypothetical protein